MADISAPYLEYFACNTRVIGFHFDLDGGAPAHHSINVSIPLRGRCVGAFAVLDIPPFGQSGIE